MTHQLIQLENLGDLPLVPFGADFHSMSSLVGDGVVSADQNGRIVLFNRAAEEIFGYTLDEVIGQSIDLLIPDRFQIQHRRDVAEFCSSMVPLRRSMGAGREVMGRCKDGGELSVEATLSRQSIGGHAVVTVVIRDVSDRKRVEISNQTVANEVAHRLLNTMAIVNSIVALTSRSATSVGDFKEALLGRLAAVARTNAYLINGSQVSADLRGLLGSELAAFHEDAKVTLTGPEVSLDGEVAAALALVIHELATNAAKYGSLSGPDGLVSLDWQVPGGEESTLHLKWREANGPAVTQPFRIGFGTSLIARSLSSHGGHAELDFHASGVNCKISLPLG